MARRHEVDWDKELVQGTPAADIAKRLGVPLGTVRCAARRRGISLNPNPRPNPDPLDAILRDMGHDTSGCSTADKFRKKFHVLAKKPKKMP